jgi:hypothetical protein
MDGFAGGMELETDFAAMLYHRRRPCANPVGRPKMTKQQAIHRPHYPEQIHG